MNLKKLILASIFIVFITSCTNKNDTPIIENDFVKFVFNPKTGGLISMADLIHQETHINTQDSLATLWRLEFLKHNDTLYFGNNDFKLINFEKNKLRNAQQLVFNWKKPDNTIVVKTSIELPDDSGIASWNIDVNVDSDSLGLSTVNFPYIKGFIKPKTYDVAFPHWNWGRLFKNCDEPIHGWYPAGESMPVQFASATKDSSSVYMATHDIQVWKKEFMILPGKLFSIKTYSENTGMSGSNFQSPFPTLFGVYTGSWFEGAKIYRNFATTAPWTKRGKLSTQKKSKAMDDISLWVKYSFTRENPKQLQKMLNYFGKPLGFHLYNWHHHDFDKHYPYYFPVKKGVKELCSDLTAKGHLVMPYINGRIVDLSNEDIHKYFPYAATDKYGKHYVEEYGNGVSQMPMCPYTGFWQNKIVSVVDQICNEIEVQGIYLDQISAADQKLCFNKKHGHPLGGGHWWNTGYRNMLDSIQHITHNNGRDKVITSEMNGEFNMDGIDGYLIWIKRDVKDIPLMTTIYSGYTRYFGSVGYGDLNINDHDWKVKQGRDFIWGTQAGWMGTNIMKPENKDKARYLKKIVNTRRLGKDYLVYGELVGLIQSDSEEEGEWKLPLIQGTVWKADNGNLGVFLVNYSNEKQTFSFNINSFINGNATLVNPSKTYKTELKSGNITTLISEWDIDFYEIKTN